MQRMATATTGMAVSPHHLASEAGARALSEGCNAVEAALVVNSMLGVVAPETCGIGGDLFALIYRDGEVSCLDASGWAGSGVDAAALRAAGHDRIPPRHRFTATIPGCVAGWTEILDRFGGRSLSSLLDPAITIALDGFPVSTELSDALTARAEYQGEGEIGDELSIDGRPPQPSETLTRPALAATLETIGKQGRDGFYRGTVAKAIGEAVAGAIEAADLAGYRPEWVTPLSLDVFDHTVWTIPPSSQGYLTLMTTALVERLGWRHADPAASLHAEIEAYRAAVADRDETLADRRHLPPDWFERLDGGHLDRLAATIDPERAGLYPAPRRVPGGTAYMCVVDSRGMGVSLIQSNFWGLGSGLGAAGFILHNRGAGFDLRPGHPNLLAPGKRPLHTLAPTLWTRHGRLTTLLGTRGGHQQPQLLSQLATAIFDRGISPQTAMELPRWTTDVTTGGADSHISFEDRVDPRMVEDLGGRGHRVELAKSWERGRGPVSVITIGPDGEATGYADPRVDTSAVSIASP